MFCVVRGYYNVTMVSPWERIATYAGGQPMMPPNHSPVDFNKDHQR